MDVKRVTIDDFDKVLEIKLESKEEERKFNPALRPVKKVIRYYKEYLRNDLSNKWRAVFIAVVDKKVVGIIVGKIYRTLKVAGYERRGYMSNLYVKPRYRRRGIGKKLVEKTIDWLKSKDAKAITLEIHNENKVTINLYHKLGFKDFTTKMVKRI